MSQSPNRIIGAVFGAVYLLVGVAGFFVTSGVAFAGTEGKALIIFDVNPLHNIIHLLIGGALLLAATRSVPASKAVNTTVGAVYLLVGVVGLFLVGSGANIIALNGADNVLHFASAILLLGVGLGADKAARTTTATARA
ncbi:DUF4383 domain-containing protein [Cellulomonas rhizosphaerae]|uniref:DUF4383 domain-containing protein n=1 Tax=Cellulomonas rhizosphaerae TaxID=2293719 RepID=A0A413RR13_9CELL|nr:DUF4383 domain-containing protein [Cellulomonas rhizosphaerae]RHA44415.1 DUF4383 domain-containing protein [Cellulomonas rhizosphaerae]